MCQIGPYTNVDCSVQGCMNGGTCQSVNLNGVRNICVCLPNVYGSKCELVVTNSICSSSDTNATQCALWNQGGYCSYTYSYNSIPVPVYCPSTCRLCTSIRSCTDSQTNCMYWAKTGLCQRVNQISPDLCKLSCGSCSF